MYIVYLYTPNVWFRNLHLSENIMYELLAQERAIVNHQTLIAKISRSVLEAGVAH